MTTNTNPAPAAKACTVCHIRESDTMPFGLPFGRGNSNNCAKHAHLPNKTNG